MSDSCATIFHHSSCKHEAKNFQNFVTDCLGTFWPYKGLSISTSCLQFVWSVGEKGSSQLTVDAD